MLFEQAADMRLRARHPVGRDRILHADPAGGVQLRGHSQRIGREVFGQRAHLDLHLRERDSIQSGGIAVTAAPIACGDGCARLGRRFVEIARHEP